MTWEWLLWPLMVALVALSAFFSSAETAYNTANDLRIKKAAESGNKQAKNAAYISQQFTRFLSTVLVGNNLVNIAFSSVVTVIVVTMNHGSETMAALIATVTLLIFGEILPKMLASSTADTLALKFARPLRMFMVVFKPVVVVVNGIVGRLSKLWTPKEAEPAVTDEDLVTILETIEDEGVFTEREGELIKSAIEITDTMAQDILVPRVDVVAFDIESDISELLDDMDRTSYSRIPVYRDSMDNIIGILHTKKLMKALLTGDKVDIESLLTPPVYVHKTRDVSSILLEFRRTHTQMAVVKDEFGGTMGILTLEDILEEVVGEIYDERDDIERGVTRAGDNTYIIDGGMNIYDVFEAIGYEEHDFESSYTTFGGWATEMLNRFPEPGDSFEFENLTVTVLEVDSMRVEKLKVVVTPRMEEEEE